MRKTINIPDQIHDWYESKLRIEYSNICYDYNSFEWLYEARFCNNFYAGMIDEMKKMKSDKSNCTLMAGGPACGGACTQSAASP